MYINITETMFIEEFRKMDRMDNFSVAGLRVLYEHLTDLEEDTGRLIECDVIAICCDWSEDTVEDIIENYSIDTADMDEDDLVEEVLAWMEGQTTAFDTGNGKILYQAF